MARRLARRRPVARQLMLTPETLPAMQRALADAQLDGWLLFDFQGVNPIVGGMLGLKGMVTRRIFVWIPREGVPHALGHAIEPGPWTTCPRGGPSRHTARGGASRAP